MTVLSAARPDAFDIADTTDAKVLNVLQAIALNAGCTASLAILARSVGLGWGGTLFLAWIGGAILTVALCAGLVWLAQAKTARHDRYRARTAARDRYDPVAAWDQDAADERAAFVRASWAAGRNRPAARDPRMFRRQSGTDRAA